MCTANPAARQHLWVGGAEVTEDGLTQQRPTDLAQAVVGHRQPPSPARSVRQRRTMVASRRTAAAGSSARLTAEITTTPVAPASSTCSALPAPTPPIPTTGSWVVAVTARNPASPAAIASGLVRVGHPADL